MIVDVSIEVSVSYLWLLLGITAILVKTWLIIIRPFAKNHNKFCCVMQVEDSQLIYKSPGSCLFRKLYRRVSMHKEKATTSSDETLPATPVLC